LSELDPVITNGIVSLSLHFPETVGLNQTLVQFYVNVDEVYEIVQAVSLFNLENNSKFPSESTLV